MKLRKSLGQHLLEDKHALSRIARESGARENAFCIEIGPGTGNLTDELLATGASVAAIELDEAMIARLERRFADKSAFTVIHSNILDCDLEEIVQPEKRPAIAVGNLPYYISSPIVFKLLENKNMFEQITVLVQKEVGDRMAAGPGSRDYGILSIYCTLEADCKVLFDVTAAAFNPPPKVDSCVVSLIPKTGMDSRISNRDIFDLTVKGSFEHRRKTCYNSLLISTEKGVSKALSKNTDSLKEFMQKAFENAGIDRKLRPEQIGVDSFIDLANHIALLRNEK